MADLEPASRYDGHIIDRTRNREDIQSLAFPEYKQAMHNYY